VKAFTTALGARGGKDFGRRCTHSTLTDKIFPHNNADEPVVKAENPYTSKQPLGEEHSFIRIGTERSKCDQTVLRIRK
jgi:hypothetical protein